MNVIVVDDRMQGADALHSGIIYCAAASGAARGIPYTSLELMSDPVPTEIRLRRSAHVLEVSFEDGSHFELPFEYLRVHSPSAEVKGHGPGQEVLVLGKEHVGIVAVEPVGQYAVKLVFDDGHDTGLYTWKYLHELGREQAAKWARYLDRRAHAALVKREPPAPSGGHCGRGPK
jgi:DUF971 family protein